LASANSAQAAPTIVPLAESMLGASRRALMMLFAAVGFLFLIACVNVANLLFAQTADARREFGVRLAIGARRRDVVRLIVVQSCTLTLPAGLLGVLFAYATFDALMALVPAQLPRAGDIAIDRHVLGFALLLSLISGAALGVLAAWRLSHGDLQGSLQSHDRATMPGRRLRTILVAAQVALAVVLLCGAALFARSFIRLTSVDLGFAPRQVLALHVRTIASKYPTVELQRSFLDDVLTRIAQVPGVTDAGAIEMLPVTRARRGGAAVAIDGAMASPIAAEPRVISAGYLEAMRIGLVLGRRFDARDTTSAPQVAIVNEALARLAWPGANPIGRRLRYEGDELREVVGVVRDVRNYAFDTPSEPQIYVPYAQTWLVPQRLVVRTDGDPATFAEAIRREIHAVDPRAATENVQTLTSYVAATIAQPRFQTSLLAIFAASGLLLSVVGVAGIVAYGVSRRRRELGIRLALGAGSRDLIVTVIAPSLLAVGAGTIVGVAGALALGRVVGAFLFELEPRDPLTLSISVGVLVGAAVAAAWIPARRAARTDPMIALRTE
jgi:predicted permease